MYPPWGFARGGGICYDSAVKKFPRRKERRRAQENGRKTFMHMADALLSPAVAGVMYAATGTAAALSIRKLKIPAAFML